MSEHTYILRLDNSWLNAYLLLGGSIWYLSKRHTGQRLYVASNPASLPRSLSRISAVLVLPFITYEQPFHLLEGGRWCSSFRRVIIVRVNHVLFSIAAYVVS